MTQISEPDLPQRVSIEPVTCPWQIEAKRLSKLRHPSRSRVLRDYLE
jgi:hypothetical protein